MVKLAAPIFGAHLRLPELFPLPAPSWEIVSEVSESRDAPNLKFETEAE